MNTDISEFDAAKQCFLHFSRTLERASSAPELRALLLADTAAPYHSFDILRLLTVTEGIGGELCRLMEEGLDEYGAP